MSTLRFSAIQELFSREPKEVVLPSFKVTDYYAENVFTKETMRKYLSKDAFKAVKHAIETQTSISLDISNAIAEGMKTWAIERGATHYTHWFQPLTDGTAEKHDGFIDYSEGNSENIIQNFTGSLLVQQEPDASSFPNGGIRQTFEARGYTAWDVSSPCFIVATTLCIPTVFVSYTGEALDYKTPLLKALQAVDKAAVDVCHYFDKSVSKVTPSLGIEQEYFLVDEALFMARPDLLLTGRTLMGHSAAKDQQLDDHYFGSIPSRVYQFMVELELESHKLGIPMKTRHNEVAPNQFEAAPIYEEVNLANDHNQLFMDLVKRVAARHKFRVLLHEKPFAGINGSGKHNNWSIITNTGVNLFSPGKGSKGNLQFLTFVINTIATVYKNQDLLRASILTGSNSHRLGGNEAPPAILSVFMGTEVTNTITRLIEHDGDDLSTEGKTQLQHGISRLPEILRDNTDRNRTSPFAFTGNRFEFRAVGSKANSAAAMTALNAALALQLREFKTKVDTAIAAGSKKEEALIAVLRDIAIESKNIIFNGDGYSDAWVQEATRRGLTNITSVPESLECYLSEQSKKVLVFGDIMSEKELEARVEVEMEKYVKVLQIEGRVLGDLAINHIIPTAVKYLTSLINNVNGLAQIFEGEELARLSKGRKELIVEISEHIDAIKDKVAQLRHIRGEVNKIDNETLKAYEYDKKVRPYMEAIRFHIDELELVVDDKEWPLPKYRELLFYR